MSRNIPTVNDEQLADELTLRGELTYSQAAAAIWARMKPRICGKSGITPVVILDGIQTKQTEPGYFQLFMLDPGIQPVQCARGSLTVIMDRPSEPDLVDMVIVELVRSVKFACYVRADDKGLIRQLKQYPWVTVVGKMSSPQAVANPMLCSYRYDGVDFWPVKSSNGMVRYFALDDIRQAAREKPQGRSFSDHLDSAGARACANPITTELWADNTWKRAVVDPANAALSHEIPEYLYWASARPLGKVGKIQIFRTELDDEPSLHRESGKPFFDEKTGTLTINSVDVPCSKEVVDIEGVAGVWNTIVWLGGTVTAVPHGESDFRPGYACPGRFIPNGECKGEHRYIQDGKGLAVGKAHFPGTTGQPPQWLGPVHEVVGELIKTELEVTSVEDFLASPALIAIKGTARDFAETYRSFTGHRVTSSSMASVLNKAVLTKRVFVIRGESYELISTTLSPASYFYQKMVTRKPLEEIADSLSELVKIGRLFLERPAPVVQAQPAAPVNPAAMMMPTMEVMSKLEQVLSADQSRTSNYEEEDWSQGSDNEEQQQAEGDRGPSPDRAEEPVLETKERLPLYEQWAWAKSAMETLPAGKMRHMTEQFLNNLPAEYDDLEVPKANSPHQDDDSGVELPAVPEIPLPAWAVMPGGKASGSLPPTVDRPFERMATFAAASVVGFAETTAPGEMSAANPTVAHAVPPVGALGSSVTSKQAALCPRVSLDDIDEESDFLDQPLPTGPLSPGRRAELAGIGQGGIDQIVAALQTHPANVGNTVAKADERQTRVDIGWAESENAAAERIARDVERMFMDNAEYFKQTRTDEETLDSMRRTTKFLTENQAKYADTITGIRTGEVKLFEFEPPRGRGGNGGSGSRGMRGGMRGARRVGFSERNEVKTFSSEETLFREEPTREVTITGLVEEAYRCHRAQIPPELSLEMVQTVLQEGPLAGRDLGETLRAFELFQHIRVFQCILDELTSLAKQHM